MSSAVPTPPAPNPAKARTFRIAAWAVLIVGGVIAIATGLDLLLIVPAYVGYLLFRRAKRYAVGSGEAALAGDARAPILYLRSFVDEETAEGAFHRFGKFGVPQERWLAQSTPCNAVQEQDALGYLFRRIGPYIALGRPGEELPELGSHKIYVVHEAWMDTVRRYLAGARLVIFSAGKTEGLRWELGEVVRAVDPTKIVLILPVDDGDYASFIAWANSILVRPLPKDYPGRIILFDAAWGPSCLARGRYVAETFAPFLTRSGIAVKLTYWEKILEHNGIRW